LNSKAVLVTGASSGIGRATAALLAKSGFRVFASVRKQEDVARLSSLGSDLTPVLMDVSEVQSIRAAESFVNEHLLGGGLYGLVNNAGIGVAGPVEYLGPETLRHMFEVNVFGQIAVTQAFLPLLRTAKGRIVNIGSVGAHISMPFGGALASTKSAFESLSDSLRRELLPLAVSVSIVEPGSIATPAIEKTLGNPDEIVGRLPAEGVRLYSRALRKFLEVAMVQERHGSPPEVVAKTIHRALTARNPRTRYPAGKHARLLINLTRFLPDRAIDLLLRRMFNRETS
jgi:NAD(P)-dependent dehydrogenase (short-subunit alcohol dehydrogenase family)